MSDAHQTIYPPENRSALPVWGGSIRRAEPLPDPLPPRCKNPEPPMTLDEAILHAEERGRERGLCGREHRQLAKWLRELRDRRLADD